MNKATRISYGIMALLMVLIAWLGLGTLLLASLFGYFALLALSFRRSRLLGVILYTIAVTVIGYGVYTFSRQAALQLPVIADQTIPAVVAYTQRQGIELPFTDYASLKALLLTHGAERVFNVGRYAWAGIFELALLVIGLVVAASLFLNVKWGEEEDLQTARDSLYATVVRELATRFATFFGSFTRVIGAQIIISVINTALTAVFLVWNDFPYLPVIVFLTFLCGLLPIVGNLMSNTLIMGVGFTLSPKMALIALLYLVLIHKLEYFLNSKIIGDRIKSPMWLTLVGIVLGEKLMGIPGMILAPVVLHYIKVEASRRKLLEEAVATPHPPPAPSAGGG
ncbi:MAG: AI-2E family transporter [Verrucomicrobia bacterium]|nr:AI-2E family transporter [Verrucomicrobiota bacterium]